MNHPRPESPSLTRHTRNQVDTDSDTAPDTVKKPRQKTVYWHQECPSGVCRPHDWHPVRVREVSASAATLSARGWMLFSARVRSSHKAG